MRKRRRWLFSDLVDVLAVQIGEADARQPVQLLDGADADRLDAVVRHPDGNGRAPVAAAAEGPVARVAQPVGEALLLDVLRHPVPARHHRVTPSQIHYN